MSMLIVSNDQNINEAYLRGNETISYDEFLAQASSEEGLDLASVAIVNINEIDDRDIYEAFHESGQIKFFTLDGYVPDFMKEDELDDIKDWSDSDSNEKASEDNVEKMNIEDDFEIKMKEDSKFKEEPQNSVKSNNQTGESAIIDPSNLQSADIVQEIGQLINENVDLISSEAEGKDVYNNKEAEVHLFGSSKGGSGKTFTTIISARRYARNHPDKKVALLDFDIIDGQVGISIHKMQPTMFHYYKEYTKGYSDHRTMKEYCVQGNAKMDADNLDFYLAPNNGIIIRNDDFWLNILDNLIHNYDAVFIDTGIDYLNVHPISYAYKIADRINITTTTSIKSVNSVTKMIQKLTGKTPNPVFNKDDDIEPRLNIIITQMIATDDMNATAYANLARLANVIATFGVITQSVSQAEYFGYWDVFDDNHDINAALDKILGE